MEKTINSTNTTLRAAEGMTLTDGRTFCPCVVIVHDTITTTATDELGNEVTTTTLAPADTTAWHEIPATEAPREPMDKDTLLANCAAYAESLKAVDFHGTDRWLTPNERANYKNALQAMQSKGVPAITIFGATITPEQGLSILEDIEVYAAMVTMTEQGHESAIRALPEAELDTYDYRVGYPTKLTY